MGDLISRSALFKSWNGLSDEIKDRDLLIDEMIRRTQDAEAVDAEPVRHGRWVWNENGLDWNLGAWVCSECGGRNENIHSGDPKYDKTSPRIWAGTQLCPNCGARMDGGKNEQ